MVSEGAEVDSLNLLPEAMEPVGLMHGPAWPAAQTRPRPTLARPFRSAAPPLRRDRQHLCCGPGNEPERRSRSHPTDLPNQRPGEREAKPERGGGGREPFRTPEPGRGTYLHFPRVVGNDEPQQDDGGEADKAFQGQREHGALQEERGEVSYPRHCPCKSRPPFASGPRQLCRANWFIGMLCPVPQLLLMRKMAIGHGGGLRGPRPVQGEAGLHQRQARRPLLLQGFPLLETPH